MAGRSDRGTGQHLDGAWSSMRERSKQRRTKLATESWPDFFKGFAIEVAVIAVIVGVVALTVALAR